MPTPSWEPNGKERAGGGAEGMVVGPSDSVEEIGGARSERARCEGRGGR